MSAAWKLLTTISMSDSFVADSSKADAALSIPLYSQSMAWGIPKQGRDNFDFQ